MAELGTINFTDVNAGTRPVSRQGEAQALVNLGNVGVKIANEGIKGKVTADMVEAIDEVSEELSPVTPGAPDETQTALGAPEAALGARIDRWKSVAAQGNQSQRTLATIRIKEILNDAQAQFPWLHDDLARRAGVVISGSAELHEMGLEDAARASAATRAQSQLDDIVDYATKEWGQDGTGGLGMSPTGVVGSPEWLAEYTLLDSLKREQQAHARNISMTALRADSTAADVHNSVVDSLQGQFNLVRADRHAIFTRNGYSEYYAEILKGDAADLEVIRQFTQVGADQIIMELTASKTSIGPVMESLLEPKLAGTPLYDLTRQMITDFITEQDAMINAFKAAKDGNPGAAQLIQAMNTNRAAHVMRGLTEPAKDFLAVMSTPEGKSILEMAQLSHTAKGLVLGEHVGGQGVGAMQQMFPSLMGSNADPAEEAALLHVTTGAGQINPSMSFGDVNAYIDKYQRDAPNPYIVTTKSDKQEEESAFWTLDKHTRVWNAARNTPELASPQQAAFFLTGSNFSLRTLLSTGTSSDISPVVRAGLADPRLQEAIDKVGDNTEYVNQRRAFGASAKEWYAGTKPEVRRAKALGTYNTMEIHGLPLNELALVDIDTMSLEGVFQYVINPKAYKAAVDKAMATEKALSLGDLDARVRPPSRIQVEERVRDDIIKAMDPISREVNESIIISTNLDHATAVNEQSRKREDVLLQYFQELGWLNGFSYNRAE